MGGKLIEEEFINMVAVLENQNESLNGDIVSDDSFSAGLKAWPMP